MMGAQALIVKECRRPSPLTPWHEAEMYGHNKLGPPFAAQHLPLHVFLAHRGILCLINLECVNKAEIQASPLLWKQNINFGSVRPIDFDSLGFTEGHLLLACHPTHRETHGHHRDERWLRNNFKSVLSSDEHNSFFIWPKNDRSTKVMYDEFNDGLYGNMPNFILPCVSSVCQKTVTHTPPRCGRDITESEPGLVTV